MNIHFDFVILVGDSTEFSELQNCKMVKKMLPEAALEPRIAACKASDLCL